MKITLIEVCNNNNNNNNISMSSIVIKFSCGTLFSLPGILEFRHTTFGKH
jgi:hypothetical protein